MARLLVLSLAMAHATTDTCTVLRRAFSRSGCDDPMMFVSRRRAQVRQWRSPRLLGPLAHVHVLSGVCHTMCCLGAVVRQRWHVSWEAVG